MRRILRWIRASDLCARPERVAAGWQAIGRWEARRVPFNLIVGMAGVVSGIAALLAWFTMDALLGLSVEGPDPPIFALFGVALYAIAANACFTGGWLAELAVRRAWPDRANEFATLAFVWGLGFAVVCTLAPAVLFGGMTILALIVRCAGLEGPPG